MGAGSGSSSTTSPLPPLLRLQQLLLLTLLQSPPPPPRLAHSTCEPHSALARAAHCTPSFDIMDRQGEEHRQETRRQEAAAESRSSGSCSGSICSSGSSSSSSSSSGGSSSGSGSGISGSSSGCGSMHQQQLSGGSSGGCSLCVCAGARVCVCVCVCVGVWVCVGVRGCVRVGRGWCVLVVPVVVARGWNVYAGAARAGATTNRGNRRSLTLSPPLTPAKQVNRRDHWLRQDSASGESCRSRLSYALAQRR